MYPLSADQVLLKGSILRNTDWCLGIAVYTGHQTKVMQNSLKARVKKSKIELQTNTYIILIVLIQLSICAISAFINVIFTAEHRSTDSYIYYDFNQSNLSMFFISFFEWFILL